MLPEVAFLLQWKHSGKLLLYFQIYLESIFWRWEGNNSDLGNYQLVLHAGTWTGHLYEAYAFPFLFLNFSKKIIVTANICTELYHSQGVFTFENLVLTATFCGGRIGYVVSILEVNWESRWPTQGHSQQEAEFGLEPSALTLKSVPLPGNILETSTGHLVLMVYLLSVQEGLGVLAVPLHLSGLQCAADRNML